MEQNEPNDLTSEQIKRLLQESILRNYPNPERKECPEQQALKELANQSLPHEHELWQHVTHCSPCYREFLEIRLGVLQFRRMRTRIALAAASAALVALVAVVWVGFFLKSAPKAPQKSHNAPSARGIETLTAVLNMEGTSSTRGIEDALETKENPLQRLPRAHIAPLLIYLPFGSQAGSYEVRVLRSGDAAKSPLASFSGNADLRDGLTILELSPDLSSFPPGVYTILVLRGGSPLWSCQFRLS